MLLKLFKHIFVLFLGAIVLASLRCVHYMNSAGHILAGEVPWFAASVYYTDVFAWQTSDVSFKYPLYHCIKYTRSSPCLLYH